MGVYIPNMEKPKSCKECPFTCEALQFFNGTDIPQSCPLIEIVTCGECKWQRVNKKNGLYGCGHRFGLIKADDDNFCPYGERRNDG